LQLTETFSWQCKILRFHRANTELTPFMKGIKEHIRNIYMNDSSDRLAGLKCETIGMEHPWYVQGNVRSSPTGHSAVDAMLGGGIASGRLHEVFAGSPDDMSSAAGFAAMLARQRGGPMLWVRQDNVTRMSGRLHAIGLNDIGIDLASLLLCTAPDAAGVLKAANEAARCPQIATVIVELWRKPAELTLTASRRLALSAETSNATILMLRVDALPEPSAATTRWSVASAPSLALPSNAPGLAALDLTLLRQRGRSGEGQWRVIWNRDNACFVEPASLPCTLRPAPRMRPLVRDHERRAA
jgi:protein ImuA